MSSEVVNITPSRRIILRIKKETQSTAISNSSAELTLLSSSTTMSSSTQSSSSWASFSSTSSSTKSVVAPAGSTRVAYEKPSFAVASTGVSERAKEDKKKQQELKSSPISTNLRKLHYQKE